MQTVKNVIIGAAGIGSRLGMNMPKCLIYVAGRRIIEYQLELLKNIENIRIVVGYKEEEVIDVVSKLRSDVVFVRNPQYAFTSTMQSIYLAIKGLKEPFVMIDGDTIIDEESFNSFLGKCNNTPIIGITKSTTEDAVFVSTEKNENGDLIVTEFQRQERKEYEWTGICYINQEHLIDKNMFVFKSLERFLPIRAEIIDCLEIDTQQDLSNANRRINSSLMFNFNKA